LQPILDDLERGLIRIDRRLLNRAFAPALRVPTLVQHCTLSPCNLGSSNNRPAACPLPRNKIAPASVHFLSAAVDKAFTCATQLPEQGQKHDWRKGPSGRSPPVNPAHGYERHARQGVGLERCGSRIPLIDRTHATRPGNGGPHWEPRRSFMLASAG